MSANLVPNAVSPPSDSVPRSQEVANPAKHIETLVLDTSPQVAYNFVAAQPGSGTLAAAATPTTDDDSTIEVGMIAGTPTPTEGFLMTDSRGLGKPLRQYVLPDGSIAMSGKGLGRGRPGIKRGPKKQRSSEEGSPSAFVTTPALSQLQSKESTPSGSKRKRSGSLTSTLLSAAGSISSRESTPEYNPTASQTRSGRQTQRPTSIITTTPARETTAPKRPSATPGSTTSTPNLKSHPKIKRRIYKGKEQFALCEHCLRSYGPFTNAIVFCDACNKCWHQRCHDPPISQAMVTDTTAEWFCSTCDRILHGHKKAKKNAAAAAAVVKSENAIAAPPVILQPPSLPPPPPPPPPVQRYGLPLVGAAALTPDQRRTYLRTLNKDQLINVILRAGDLAPQLPMYETLQPLPPPPPPTQPIYFQPPQSKQFQPQFSSSYTTPVDHPIGVDINNTTVASSSASSNFNNPNKSNQPTSLEDEGYFDDATNFSYDEHALLYPKPGQSLIQLPPDRTDLHMLLEDPSSKTFSHWVAHRHDSNGVLVRMKDHVDTVLLR